MKLITKQDSGNKFDEFYNHPVSTADPTFIRKYEAVVDQLAQDLEAIGSVSVDNDQFGVDVDFSLSRRDAHTRTVVIVSSNPGVFSKKLVETIGGSLRKYPEKYRVILDAWFSRIESCYVFIDQDEVAGWFDDPEKAVRFEK